MTSKTDLVIGLAWNRKFGFRLVSDGIGWTILVLPLVIPCHATHNNSIIILDLTHWLWNFYAFSQNVFHAEKYTSRCCCILCAGDNAANKAIKRAFQYMHSKIVDAGVNPDSVIDKLLSKKVMSRDEYCRLRQIHVSRDRCQDMLSLLYHSSRPQTFIHLRLALLDEYPWLVCEIDVQLPSLTSQLQQLSPSHPKIGKILV